MHRLSKAVVCVGLLFLPSCAMLDREVPVFDQVTGKQTGTVRVGDMIADSGEDVAGSVVGMLTGNPILAGAAAAAAGGGFAGARRKKRPQVEEA